MTSQIDVAISASAERQTLWRTMAKRSRLVSLIDDSTAASALITDDARLACEAVRRGQYTLILTPFDVSVENRHALESSQKAMPANIRRYDPAIQQVKRSLDDGRLGEPGLLRIHRWAASLQESNRALLDALDVALWMFDAQADSVNALQHAGHQLIHLGFPNGGMAVIDVDGAVPTGNAYGCLSLIGSAGAAYADDHSNVQLALTSQRMSAVSVPQAADLPALINAFASAVLEGQDLSPQWRAIEQTISLSDQVRSSLNHQDAVTAGVSDV